MSESQNSPVAAIKVALGAIGAFLFFGFLALILSGYAGRETPEERAYRGDFSPEVIEQRWANRAEIDEAQAELYDEAKVDAALAKVLDSAPKAGASGVVVPGSPTFMKQMEAPAEEPAAKVKEATTEKPAEKAKESEAEAEPIVEDQPVEKDEPATSEATAVEEAESAAEAVADEAPEDN